MRCRPGLAAQLTSHTPCPAAVLLLVLGQQLCLAGKLLLAAVQRVLWARRLAAAGSQQAHAAGLDLQPPLLSWLRGLPGAVTERAHSMAEAAMLWDFEFSAPALLLLAVRGKMGLDGSRRQLLFAHTP